MQLCHQTEMQAMGQVQMWPQELPQPLLVLPPLKLKSPQLMVAQQQPLAPAPWLLTSLHQLSLTMQSVPSAPEQRPSRVPQLAEGLPQLAEPMRQLLQQTALPVVSPVPLRGLLERLQLQM